LVHGIIRESVGDEEGKTALRKADCKKKPNQYQSVRALYCHCRDKAGEPYHCAVWESLAERIALETPLSETGDPGLLPDDIGADLPNDFPELMRRRREKFGRGGGHRGAAPTIPRARAVADSSQLARACGDLTRARQEKAAAAASEKLMRERSSELAAQLANSRAETAKANERLAGLEDDLWRARQQSERIAHRQRSEAHERHRDEAHAREAESRARAADASRSDAERERDRLRAEVDKLKAAGDERRAKEAAARAEATVLHGGDDDDDVDALDDRVLAFRSAVATTLSALGGKDVLNIWDGIYREVQVGRDTLVEDVMEIFGPAVAAVPKEFLRPVRVRFTERGAVTQRSRKSAEAGIDDGGLRNEMYAQFFEQLLLQRPDLFASAGAVSARALPTPDAERMSDVKKDYEAVGRVMCRAVIDGRPIPKALASSIVLRFLQGVEPAALDANGAMVRGSLSKAALLDELLLIDSDTASSIGKYILNDGLKLADMFATVGDALCYTSTEDRAADRDAQILALPWSDEPAFRILVFERLVQRSIIEPRRQALEALRRGFATVAMVPRLTRTLFPSSKALGRFISGDDELSAEKLWSLFTFDTEDYDRTMIEYEHESNGVYGRSEPTMRYLREALGELCDAQRLKFFKFVTGLSAIPATCPGEAKPFQLLVYGKGSDVGRLPTASTCYYQLHCPPYPSKEILMGKLRPAIEAEGFDQK